MHSRLVFEHLGELCVDLVCGEDGHDADIEKALELALRGQSAQVFIGQQVDLDLSLGETLEHLPLTLLDIAGTEFSLLYILQVNALARLFELLDQLISLSRSRSLRGCRGRLHGFSFLLCDFLSLFLLFLFLLLLFFRSAVGRLFKLFLNLLDASEREVVMLQVLQNRDIVLQVEVREVARRVDLLEVNLLFEHRSLGFLPQLHSKRNIG